MVPAAKRAADAFGARVEEKIRRKKQKSGCWQSAEYRESRRPKQQQQLKLKQAQRQRKKQQHKSKEIQQCQVVACLKAVLDPFVFVHGLKSELLKKEAEGNAGRPFRSH